MFKDTLSNDTCLGLGCDMYYKEDFDKIRKVFKDYDPNESVEKKFKLIMQRTEGQEIHSVGKQIESLEEELKNLPNAMKDYDSFIELCKCFYTHLNCLINFHIREKDIESFAIVYEKCQDSVTFMRFMEDPYNCIRYLKDAFVSGVEENVAIIFKRR